MRISLEVETLPLFVGGVAVVVLAEVLLSVLLPVLMLRR